MATTGKPITCKAAVTWKANGGFSIETVEVAVPKKGEVRVRMTSTGVCHSDLHMMEGFDKSFPFPCILGHEGAGIIESVGEGVTSVKPGDIVVMVFEAFCGDCDFCKDPRTNMCKKQTRNQLQMDGTSRITCKGQPIHQMASISTFSEYTVTSEMNVTKVNPKANPNDLAFAGCCIPTGYGAVMKAAKMPPGSTCAVWGLGGVGMCVLMGCRDSGASKIIGIDPNPNKFPAAKQFGATHFLNPREVANVPEKLAEITNGGVDYCFVSVGVTPAMEQAFMSSHPQWGKTVIIGLAEIGETMKAGIWELIYGRQLIGTYYGSYKARLDIPQLVEKVVNGQIQLDKLISHRLPLARIADGFNMLHTGESLRTIIDYDLKA
ncbi:alcohol dehydrogenase class-3 [Trichonephila inaurata madagascariensis]|uniref:Alcohol dehydrogenase class-3 n=1 Tax=Trichonephila inaurata madagascariensis TaxID=2747483 RepID=A0A8X7C0H0_9ARAC|nr:alcohol dehydrogenase class-3 [Trichonephila inaurata madagascariensis]